jgi:preprotein translocase subunit YajC
VEVPHVDKLGPLLPILLLAALFWLMVVRPARNRQAQQRSLVARLRPGQQIMTTAGLFGTVTGVDGDQIELEIADGVTVRYIAAAVARIVEPDATEPGLEGHLGEATSPGADAADLRGTSVDHQSSILRDDTPEP